MALHPFIESMLETMVGRPVLSAGTPEDGRALVAAGRLALGKGRDLALAKDLRVVLRAGDLSARYFATENPDGVVLYLHSRGWVRGALDDHETYARSLNAEIRAAGAAINRKTSDGAGQ